MQPAARRERGASRTASKPATRSRAKSATRRPIKHCHLHHQGEPHLRPGLRRHERKGNGDPSLCLFPEAVTPNHHKLAREFVLLDNFYVDGEVSRRRPRVDDGRLRHRLRREDLAARAIAAARQDVRLSRPKARTTASPGRPAATSGTGANEAKVSATAATASGSTNGKKPDGTFADGKATVKALEGHFDPKFRGYDLDYPDVKRAERFIAELKRFETGGRDAAAADRAAAERSHRRHARRQADADRDGRRQRPGARAWWSRRVSKSKFWKETAIFVVEDDAQNGPDHVDAHRAVALVDQPVHEAQARRFDACTRRRACCGRWS